MIRKVVFFIYDTTPRIERRIESFIEEGYDVEVYGHRFNDSKVNYCISDKYTYNVIAEIPHHASFASRISGLKKVRQIVRQYDSKTTLFYFFTLNVAAIAPFLNIRYIYEESDMLFARFRKKLPMAIVEAVNKLTVRRSAITVMTSEGFADYYYGNKVPKNIVFLLNKIHKRCLELPRCERRPLDMNHLRFAFVGNVRYPSLVNSARAIASNYPQHEFHFFGNAEALPSGLEHSLDQFPNVYWYGPFKNPDDLPAIYAKFDILICTYDVTGLNPRYAEPNKLYEAIFFETPIVVSPQSYLEKKVKQLNVGTSVDADDEQAVIQLVKSLTEERINEYLSNIRRIDKRTVIFDNQPLFDRIAALQ